ncbi:unnamed protein product [Lymnaea stagnalis]|uniref:Uncharacterized protein n=1 Tax=Lymnaea stagnalis TaxID=6523 RepID=A0AAV2HLK2_LYMST
MKKKRESMFFLVFSLCMLVGASVKISDVLPKGCGPGLAKCLNHFTHAIFEHELDLDSICWNAVELTTCVISTTCGISKSYALFVLSDLKVKLNLYLECHFSPQEIIDNIDWDNKRQHSDEF